MVKDLPQDKIVELLKMDAAAESIPATPPATRYLAWAFLTTVILMMLILGILTIRKAQRQALPSGPDSQPRAEAPDIR